MANYIAVHDRKITNVELTEVFGKSMPLEVADILIRPLEQWETLITTRLKINELVKRINEQSPNNEAHS